MIKSKNTQKRVSLVSHAIGRLLVECTNIRTLEAYIEAIKDKTLVKGVRYTGPVTYKKKLSLACRRSTSGEGSGTQFYYTYTIWKKVLRIHSPKVIDIITEIPRADGLNISVDLYTVN